MGYDECRLQFERYNRITADVGSRYGLSSTCRFNRSVKDSIRASYLRLHVCRQRCKNAIVHWYNTRHQWTIDPDTIIFQPGVVPAIATIIETFTEPGDKIGMSTPAYPPFTNVPAAQKREVVTCELTEQNGHYTMNFEELEEMFRSGIKLFVLCNPHNPIGIVWCPEELEQLVALCIQYDVYLLSDEIHADISIQKAYTPVLTLSNANEAKIITCIAPTKTFNIAGIHAAMIVAPDRKLYTAIEKIHRLTGI